jgi:hypothetical protein
MVRSKKLSEKSEKLKSLPSARARALDKEYIKKKFLCRVPKPGHSAKNILKNYKNLCQVPG